MKRCPWMDPRRCSLNRAPMPFTQPGSEERVNERRQSGAAGEDQEQADDQQDRDHREKPPLFVLAEETPELFHKRYFVHKPTPIAQPINAVCSPAFSMYHR